MNTQQQEKPKVSANNSKRSLKSLQDRAAKLKETLATLEKDIKIREANKKALTEKIDRKKRNRGLIELGLALAQMIDEEKEDQKLFTRLTNDIKASYTQELAKIDSAEDLDAESKNRRKRLANGRVQAIFYALKRPDPAFLAKVAPPAPKAKQDKTEPKATQPQSAQAPQPAPNPTPKPTPNPAPTSTPKPQPAPTQQPETKKSIFADLPQPKTNQITTSAPGTISTAIEIEEEDDGYTEV